MAYQEVRTTNYGTRVGRSFKSIGTSLLLFIGGTTLHWWHEGRAVKTDKMLNDAENVCIMEYLRFLRDYPQSGTLLGQYRWELASSKSQEQPQSIS